MNELVRAFVTGGLVHRHRAQGARIELFAPIEAAVDDHPPADEGPEVDVQRTAPDDSVSGNHLRGTGRRGVVVHRHRQAGRGFQLGGDVDLAPCRDRLALQAEDVRPFVQDPGHGDAESDDPGAQAGLQGINELDGGTGRQGHRLVGQRGGVGRRPGSDDVAAEIDQEDLDAAAPDLDSEGEGAFGIECDWREGLSDPPAHFVALDE